MIPIADLHDLYIFNSKNVHLATNIYSHQLGSRPTQVNTGTLFDPQTRKRHVVF